MEQRLSKKVMILTGAGQIGMAIARRIGSGMKIVIGDKNIGNAHAIARTMNQAGFDTIPLEMDLSSRDSILHLIAEAQRYGNISMLVNAAGVSPSQASVETILKVDLYGTAVLLEEVGKVICPGGSGVTISSQSGHRMPALTAEQDEQLAMTPTEELLNLELLQPGNIKYSISPGIIVTPLAIDEFNGPRGDFYRNMFAKCPARRPGTADEIAHVAELLMGGKGAFITGADFLVDGGATAPVFLRTAQNIITFKRENLSDNRKRQAKHKMKLTEINAASKGKHRRS